MTDPTPDPIPDVVPDPVVPEPPSDPEPEPESHPEPDGDERPGFVDEIINHIDGIVERLTKDAPEPIEPIVDPEPDSSPARKPWTHRGMFRKD